MVTSINLNKPHIKIKMTDCIFTLSLKYDTYIYLFQKKKKNK